MVAQKCNTSICIENHSYTITRSLLDKLFENAKKAGQKPQLELLINIEGNNYYQLRCKVEKVNL
jgi:hypothetical protein